MKNSVPNDKDESKGEKIELILEEIHLITG